mmetsp:Transcript_36963/g.59979  ORF Transcript_36963/g.59979 Transcript_36963/m.59979 type:complete len:255 (+) Transcript_36963:898-1662(+)
MVMRRRFPENSGRRPLGATMSMKTSISEKGGNRSSEKLGKRRGRKESHDGSRIIKGENKYACLQITSAGRRWRLFTRSYSEAQQWDACINLHLERVMLTQQQQQRKKENGKDDSYIISGEESTEDGCRNAEERIPRTLCGSRARKDDGRETKKTSVGKRVGVGSEGSDSGGHGFLFHISSALSEEEAETTGPSASKRRQSELHENNHFQRRFTLLHIGRESGTHDGGETADISAAITIVREDGKGVELDDGGGW